MRTELKPPQHHLPIDPRIRSRRIQVARDQGRRRLTVLSWILAVVALASGGFVSVHSTLFAVKSVTVTGATHETPKDVAHAAGVLTGRTPMIDVNPAISQRGIELLAWVQSARVVRHWPWHVAITVVERNPVALVEPPGSTRGSQPVPQLVDRTGRVLGEALPGTQLPVIVTGGAVPRPGNYLGDSYTSVLHVAADIPPVIIPLVNQVVVEPAGQVDLVLVQGTEVVLGPSSDLGAKMEALATLEKVAALKGALRVDLEFPGQPTVTP